MKSLKYALAALLAAGVGNIANAEAAHPDAQVTPLMTKVLADYPGKEATVITVNYPPGGESPIHKHNAHAFVYVLEGSIVMGLRGGKNVTLMPGETFYEGPADIHTVSRNASAIEPAKFLVFLLKGKGAQIVLPAQ
jgi:quercetin dioxygenase-like cupin family protein